MKGQLKSLQKVNPATTPAPLHIPLWQKFGAARKALKKASGSPAPAFPAKTDTREVHLAFYRNGDPYSYASLVQHADQITHVCPEWMTVVNGMGDLQIDPDTRLPKLTAAHGIALMPLLTNQLGDTWQPEAVENLANAGRRGSRDFSTTFSPLCGTRKPPGW